MNDFWGIICKFSILVAFVLGHARSCLVREGFDDPTRFNMNLHYLPVET
jgi:hypothetical protein